jgi:hypothetical protein
MTKSALPSISGNMHGLGGRAYVPIWAGASWQVLDLQHEIGEDIGQMLPDADQTNWHIDRFDD